MQKISSYDLMRELLVLSVNIYYVKEAIQKFHRSKSTLLYLNVTISNVDMILHDLNNRKRNLQKRFRKLFEIQLLELNDSRKDIILAVSLDEAGWKRKELEQGFAVITDILNTTFILDLRTGILSDTTAENFGFFENRKKLLGNASIYNHFNIDVSHPLNSKNLRY